MNRKPIFGCAWWQFVFLVVIFPIFARADALDNWTSCQTSNVYFLTSVTYAENRYVIVGYRYNESGVIQTSEEGQHWTDASFGYGEYFRDITYGNGTFVAVGIEYFNRECIYYSTNGAANWFRYLTDIGFDAVTYSGGRFVAVGHPQLIAGYPLSPNTNKNIYTSVGGITWQAVASVASVQDVQYIRDVASANNRFLAVDQSGNVYYSTGTTWTRRQDGIFGGRINSCNGVYIAMIGNPPTNYIGTVGVTGNPSWSVMVKDTTNVFQRVVYNNGLYVALPQAGGPKIFTSTNSVNWIARDIQVPPNFSFVDVAIGSRNVLLIPGVAWPSAVYVSDPFVDIRVASDFPPQIQVSGLIGRNYRIEHLTDLRSNDWQTLVTFPLTNSPMTWTDSTATNSSRCYRAVLLP